MRHQCRSCRSDVEVVKDIDGKSFCQLCWGTGALDDTRKQLSFVGNQILDRLRGEIIPQSTEIVGAADQETVEHLIGRVHDLEARLDSQPTPADSIDGAPGGHTSAERALIDRLVAIEGIIEAVDNRAMAADGPVTPTLQEMRQDEMSRIWDLARGVGLGTQMTPADALTGFVAWITTRRESITASSAHDSAGWAELVRRYCEHNGWGNCSQAFPDTVSMPPE